MPQSDIKEVIEAFQERENRASWLCKQPQKGVQP